MEPIKFWPFILRCLAKSATESADFFELKVKTAIIAVVLVLLGFVLLFLVRGLEETRAELYKYFILVPAPAILFLAGLFVYNAFRAPYLIYVEEYTKARAEVEKSEMAKQQAESASKTAEAKIEAQQKEIENLKGKLKSHQPQSSQQSPTQNPNITSSLSDGQVSYLKSRLLQLKGNNVRILCLGDVAVACEQMNAIFEYAQWNIERAQVGTSPIGAGVSYMTGSDISGDVAKAVFRIFQEAHINLPIVPDGYAGPGSLGTKPPVVVVIR